MAKDHKMSVDNSGENSGVLVGTNNGTINYQLQNNTKIPSMITEIVKTLGNIYVDNENESSSFVAFEIDDKIQHNSIIKYREIIRAYAIYFYQCENAMDLYDNSNIDSKARILHCVKIWYLEFKGDLLLLFKDSHQTEIELVRDNADLLIENIYQKIKEAIVGSSNNTSMNIEDVDLGVICFVCYCFMKCKILEKPL